MKYPIGIQSFDKIIEDGFLYIDKTDLVYRLTHEGNIYFLSRPRRFGKSLLVSTLKNYYLGRKELFSGLKIDSLEKDWKVYPVFHIDFNGEDFTQQGILQRLIDSYISTWEHEMGIVTDTDIPTGFRFKRVLEAAHNMTGLRAVVLVDEYDKPMLDVMDVDKSLEEEHRNILKGFYSVFKSGTPTYLLRLLAHSDENMNEITGKYYAPKEFIDYKATVEQPLPMIYQSGYLTIKKYDMEENSFLLDYPNNEVKEGFLSLVAAGYFNTRESVDSWIRSAVSQLKKAQLDDFRDGLTSFLASIPYTMRRKENERERERYFHYTFYLIMRLISVYTVYTEKVQSRGRVDCIVETPDYVYIFEFKLDGTAEEALRQIEEKGYALEYASDSRKLYKIGAVFSSETGTIAEFVFLGDNASS